MTIALGIVLGVVVFVAGLLLRPWFEERMREYDRRDDDEPKGGAA